MSDSDEQHDPDESPERYRRYADLNNGASVIGMIGVALIVFGMFVLAIGYRLGDGNGPRLLLMLGMSAGMLGAMAFLLAIFLRVFGAVTEAWWKIRSGRLRLHHLWKDDRPIPASPGRRMLRVFGRLAKHVGLFGIIAVAAASVFGRFSELLAIFLVGSVALLFAGYATDMVDSFLAGLYEEDDESELDDLKFPHEVAPESESNVDHDR